MTMPTFCIVTPVRNGAEYLNMAITHIVSQAGDFRIRYHIQDGGSTDGTLDIIKKWEEMLSMECPIVQCRGIEFSWASEPDNGIYDAINKGYARMDIPDDALMSWCNADDIYLPRVFAGLTALCKDIPEVSYIAGNWRFFEHSRLFEFIQIKGPYPQEIMKNYCCDGYMWTQPPQPSIFWKGKLWREAGHLNSELKYAGDYEYWQRLANHAECIYWPLSMSMCMRHDAQLAKERPAPDAATFYEQEKEKICPRSQRIAFMKQFWKKRILPPYGLMVTHAAEGYQLERRRCWPVFWGSTWWHYVWRRCRYLKNQLKAKVKQRLKR